MSVASSTSLSDSSPAVSSVIHTTNEGDATIVSTWTSGRDAVSAALALAAPQGQTTVFDHATGIATNKANVTYYGLPVIGFAAQSYSTTGLPGTNPNVLSSYGGAFAHKMTRRIDIVR